MITPYVRWFILSEKTDIDSKSLRYPRATVTQMGNRKNLPDHALVVTKYDEFHQLIDAFVDGHHELMTILGGPGLGKSEEVKRRMQAKLGAGRWTLIKGKHTSLNLYERLFHSRLLPLVLDDLDGLFRSPDNTAILKCVCDTQLVKRVEWGSTHAAFERMANPLPKGFESISRVCVIANDWTTLNKNISALQDRGLLIVFRPSPLEVHKEVGRAGWFDDPEVFDFIGRNLYLINKPSFRLYITAKNHKKSGMDWKSLILRTIENESTQKLILVAHLVDDPSYDALPTPETEREVAFKKMGGGSRATYHRHKKVLNNLRNRPDATSATEIRLQPALPDLYSRAMLDRRKQLEAMRDDDDEAVNGVQVSDENDSRENNAENRDEKPQNRVCQLQRELEKAVAIENYELAAKLRDELKQLENQ